MLCSTFELIRMQIDTKRFSDKPDSYMPCHAHELRKRTKQNANIVRHSYLGIITPREIKGERGRDRKRERERKQDRERAKAQERDARAEDLYSHGTSIDSGHITPFFLLFRSAPNFHFLCKRSDQFNRYHIL